MRESGPHASRDIQPKQPSFKPTDFLMAKEILEERESKNPNSSTEREIERVRRIDENISKRNQGSGGRTEAVGDIAEAAVFSVLNHKDNSFHSLKNVNVSIELSSHVDDVLKGIDGALIIESGGRRLAEIHYDATTNPAAVLRKVEESVFYPKDPSHTKVVLGFDTNSLESVWQSVRGGSFAPPSFLLLLKEMEVQLRAHQSYAEKMRNPEHMKRCAQELLFVTYMLKQTPKAMPVDLLKDKVYAAITEASEVVEKTHPHSFRMGRAKAA